MNGCKVTLFLVCGFAATRLARVMTRRLPSLCATHFALNAAKYGQSCEWPIVGGAEDCGCAKQNSGARPTAADVAWPPCSAPNILEATES
jgi:hypothetical protein